MDYDFGIFHKLKEVYDALRKLAWGAVTAVGALIAAVWWLLDWIPARAIQLFDWLHALVPEKVLDFGTVGIDWARINQFVPINEAVAMGKAYLALAGALLLWKMIKKVMPFA